MSWSLASPVYGSIDWLRREVANELKFDADLVLLNHNQRTEIDSIIQSGLDDFYTPQPLGDAVDVASRETQRRAPYVWSFLQTTESFTIGSGVSEYALPATFSGFLGDPTCGTGKLSLISESEVRQMIALGQSGVPKYAALRRVPGTGSVLPSARIVVAPVPAGSTTITIQYSLHPDRMSDAKPLPLCGPEHYETVRVCCCAVIERRKGVDGPFIAQRQERLLASIAVDQNSGRTSGEPTWASTPDTYGTLAWLRSEVANQQGYSPNFSLLTQSQKREVDSIIQSGVDRFYSPNIGADISGTLPYIWTFLRVTEPVTFGIGVTEHTLPARFSRFLDELTSSSGRLVMVSEVEVRQILASGATGAPRYAAVRVTPSNGANRPVSRLIVAPAPTGSTVVVAQYGLYPESITEARPELLCGNEHFETVRLCCLAVAEQRRSGAGAITGLSQERLLASVIADRDSIAAKEVVRSLSTPDYGSIGWLRKEISVAMGFSDYSVLDYSKRSEIDSVIDVAVPKFYFPPPTEVTIANPTEAQKERLRRGPYSWSFLQKITTVSVVAGTTAYDLPADFANFLGEPTTTEAGRRISIASESHLRQLIDSDTKRGAPKYAASRLVSGSGTAKPTWQVVLYPIPKASETIKIQYAVQPPRLSDAFPWPMSGVEHAPTVLAFCLAEVERRTKGGEGPGATIAMERLQASIAIDQQSAFPTIEGIFANETDEESAAFGRKHYLKHIGIKRGYGPNPDMWTEPQRRMAAEIMKLAAQRVVNPSVLPGESYPHHWSWLKPLATLTTEADKSEYALPDDFQMLEGPIYQSPGSNVIYREIIIRGEYHLRERYQSDGVTGRPTEAAVRLAPDYESSVGTRYVLLLWPTPDDAYELNFRYSVNPENIFGE